MSRRAKGWLALFGLVLVVVGFGVALGTSRAARVRYWAWRMRSGDRETRLAARRRLLEIDRPGIDGVFADLVAGEASDRLAEVAPGERVAFVGSSAGLVSDHARPRPSDGFVYGVEVSLGRPLAKLVVVWLPPGGLDPIARTLACGSHGALRELVVGEGRAGKIEVHALLIVALAADDPLGPAVIEAMKAQLWDVPPNVR